MKAEEITDQDRADRREMLRLYQERGAMTSDQLVAAGISRESQARNAEAVAQKVRKIAA